MSPFALGGYVGFSGAALLFVASFFARNTGGYQFPLDPLGADPLAEKEMSEMEAPYNRNPKGHLRSLALKFLIFGVAGLVLDVFFR